MADDPAIILTGANGQVGHEICRLAAEQQLALLAFNRQQLDITDRQAVNDKITAAQPVLLINCAAYTAVDKAEEDKELADRVNRDGVKNLAEICKALQTPLLHISTDYVFDGDKVSAYGEEDKANPQGVYGLSKWQGEEALRHTLAEHLILRTSWVFGYHGNNFVKTILRLAEEHDKLRIVADQSGCPTYAADIAKTALSLAKKILAEAKIDWWGTYHYCGEPATNWHLFAEAIITGACKAGLQERFVSVVPITTKEYPTPASRPKNSVLDCSKIKRVLGISSPSWRAGLDDMLELIAGEN